MAENAQTADIISEVRRKFTDVYCMFTFQYRTPPSGITCSTELLCTTYIR